MKIWLKSKGYATIDKVLNASDADWLRKDAEIKKEAEKLIIGSAVQGIWLEEKEGCSYITDGKKKYNSRKSAEELKDFYAFVIEVYYNEIQKWNGNDMYDTIKGNLDTAAQFAESGIKEKEQKEEHSLGLEYQVA